MKSSVIVFPGSNCDRDIAKALEKMQFKNQMVWHKETKLPKSDLIVIPGGFSYGDYLRSGAIAGKSLIIDEVIKYTKYLITDVVKPKKMVYISFDGSAPISKMVQQRCRRHKSILEEGYIKYLKKKIQY